MKHYLHLFLLLLFPITTVIFAQNNIDISGKWSVQLDNERQGLNENGSWQAIHLPGSLTEAGLGEKTAGSDFGILTQTYKYIGVAWYQREINIPKEFKNKEITVFLERVLWESKVFLDGKPADIQDGLGTAHIHKLGIIKPGKHILTVRVDNDMIHNIGDKGHAYGDYTQSIWNGIVGRIELQARDLTQFTSVRTFPDIDNDKLKVEFIIKSAKKGKAEITLNIKDLDNKTVIGKIKVKESLTEGINKMVTSIDLHGKLKKWTEFNPVTYILNASIKSGKYKDQTDAEFGFLKISHGKHNVLINNEPVFLRGNLD